MDIDFSELSSINLYPLLRDFSTLFIFFSFLIIFLLAFIVGLLIIKK